MKKWIKIVATGFCFAFVYNPILLLPVRGCGVYNPILLLPVRGCGVYNPVLLLPVRGCASL